MFCNQCEQTARGTGCTIQGVCGKNSTVAHLQDTIVYALRRMAHAALHLRAKGVATPAADELVSKALFCTLTNTNFDPAALENILEQIVLCQKSMDPYMDCEADSCPADTRAVMILLKQDAPSVDELHPNPDICSAMQCLLFGLKGMAAYTFHAGQLGMKDAALPLFLYEGLVVGTSLSQYERSWQGVPEYFEVTTKMQPGSLGDWLNLILRCGTMNIRAMELLEAGNTNAFGHPQPTEVSLGHRKGKAILVSGHDLLDLYEVLQQSVGTGLFVYTHGEMLPAHAYPRLHEFSHLAGHFGTAWQNQHRELPDFPGPVLFTTNCIQNPEAYADKVFTSHVTAWPGQPHLEKNIFQPLIDKALAMPGFSDNSEHADSVNTGFGRKTLLAAAPKLVEALKAGTIRHIFLVGGCDGAKPGRNYYTEFVEKTPADTLVLTLACGKFRFFTQKLGAVGDFPRLMDVGQCNDAYAAIQMVLALAEALNCNVNQLPLSLVLSWYEQKAVAVLLSLLSLGIKQIRLGPSMPAFLNPTITNALIETYDIAPITTPEADLRALLG